MSFFSNLFNRRKREMQKIAEQLSMDYYPNDDSGMIDYLEDFKIFSKGRSKKLKIC